MSAQRPSAQRRDFPGRRWISVTLRSLHLVGVVLVGAALFGSGAYRSPGAALMLLTGIGMYGIELWSNPKHLREVAGLFIPLKLVGVAAMLVAPERTALLFWLLLVASSIVSHAPASFRHRQVPRR